jgi:ribosome-associated toxin RatA of RatAB toxin-antitoxin module
MATAKRTIEINASREKLFGIIVDYERYPDFLTHMKSARIVYSSKKEKTVEFTLNLIKTIHYTLRLKEEKNFVLSWSLQKGEWMKVNSGGWKLEEISENKTKATYFIELGFGPLVPKKISQMLSEIQLPQTLEAFKKRAEEA